MPENCSTHRRTPSARDASYTRLVGHLGNFVRIRRKPLVTFNFACLNPKFVHCILCDETVNAADIVNRTGTMICPGYLASVRVQAFNLGFAVECSTAKSTKSTPRKQCLFASFFFSLFPSFHPRLDSARTVGPCPAQEKNAKDLM